MNAKFSARLAATIIDFLLVFLVVIIINQIIGAIIKPVLPPAEFTLLMEAYMNGNIGMAEYLEKYELILSSPEWMDFQKYSTTVYTAEGISFVVIFVCYFIVLPLTWKKGQTVGRHMMKIKVIDEDSNELSVSTCIIRELVGNLLVSFVLNCCCCIPLIINLIIMNGDSKKSIADGIARSKVISTIDAIIEEDHNVTTNSIDGDYIFKDDNE